VQKKNTNESGITALKMDLISVAKGPTYKAFQVKNFIAKSFKITDN